MSRITVKKRLYNPHPLVQQVRAVFKDKGEHAIDQQYGVFRAWRWGCIDIRVTPANFRRACLIMDAWVKGLEANGCIVRVDGRKTLATVGGHDFEIFVAEPTLQTKEPTDDNWRDHTATYTPTDKLTLGYRGPYLLPRERDKTWDEAIEDCLDEAMGRMFAAAERCQIIAAQQAKIDKHHAHQRRLRQRRKEAITLRKEYIQQKVEKLEAAAERWARANLIREYIADVEEDVGSDYAQWATKYTDLLTQTG